MLGACAGLEGLDVPALDRDDLNGRWRERTDLHHIVDRMSREAVARLGLAVYTTRPTSEGLEAGFRYMGTGPTPHVAVGIREGRGGSPFWIRVHRATSHLEQARNRLVEAGYDLDTDDAGHLWWPLPFQPSAGSALGQVHDAATHIVDFYAAAVGARTP
jgi:hypothetical protein